MTSRSAPTRRFRSTDRTGPFHNPPAAVVRPAGAAQYAVEPLEGRVLLSEASAIVTGLPPGAYRVSEFVPPGYRQTAPSPATRTLTVAGGQAFTHEDLANRSEGELSPTDAADSTL